MPRATRATGAPHERAPFRVRVPLRAVLYAMYETAMISKDPRNILLGVTGGIAAYKSPEIVRRLKERGHRVRVVMTAGAMRFISPLTLQAVSGEPVRRTLLDEQAEAGMGHIELARWAELVLIAPATANCMALLAGGHANDLLGTLCLATTAPIVLAPAMNQQMWLAPATQENRQRLEDRGVRLLGPGEGSQACGEVGPGRMWEPEAIVGALDLRPASGGAEMLAGLEVLVTAGPTREAIDPVRYISNHSSGKMGHAVAAAARALGARVTLVSGPTALRPPEEVERVDVTSAEQMYEAVLQRVGSTDIFIAAAAVADYAPVCAASQKLKKKDVDLTIELQRTRDILAAVAGLEHAPFTVGFAAETNALREHARAKLESKGLDMIAGNDVSAPGIGFDADENALTVFWRDGEIEIARAPKPDVAAALVDQIARRYREKRPPVHS